MRQRGQSEGTGARRDTAEESKEKRKKKEKESERGETEQDTNDHMKRTSHEQRESDCATQKAVLCLSPPSQQSNTQILSEFDKGN